jgi:hypothetical protein
MVKETSSTTQISVRVDDDWIDDIDMIAELLSRPGIDVTRADAMRAILARGVQELMRELEPVRKARGLKLWIDKYAKKR